MGTFILLVGICIWIGAHAIAYVRMGPKVTLILAGLIHFIALLPLFLMRNGLPLTLFLDAVLTIGLFSAAMSFDSDGNDSDSGDNGRGSGGGGKFLRNVGIATAAGYVIGKKLGRA